MLHTFEAAADQWRAEHGGAEAIGARQHERLGSLLLQASTHSRFYADRYGDRIPTADEFSGLPTVTKPELMADFDTWITNPRFTRARIDAFLAKETAVGEPCLEGHFICRTSGTTGEPGIFIHDPQAVDVYAATTTRLDLNWLRGMQWADMLGKRARWAAVVGTGGHFAGEGWMELERRRAILRRNSFAVVPVTAPIARIVASLNEFDPAVLTTYPSMLAILVAEQRAGRLHIHPVLLETSGETLESGLRQSAAMAFGVPVHESYSCSEMPVIGFDCSAGWLHVNADWCILEPIDSDGSPTPTGMPSSSVLLTNLANHVQPIIRYDLGDSVIASPSACSCGNPLPAIRVLGRHDDTLHLPTATGGLVAIAPLALATVADDDPRIVRSQLVQIALNSVSVRLEVVESADAAEAWAAMRERLRRYLTAQGVCDVMLERDDRPPSVDPASGKFRQVIALHR